MKQPVNSENSTVNATPLFRHPRLIAVAMLVVLAAITGSALYLRPLSGDTETARAQGAPQT